VARASADLLLFEPTVELVTKGPILLHHQRALEVNKWSDKAGKILEYFIGSACVGILRMAANGPQISHCYLREATDDNVCRKDSWTLLIGIG